MTTPTRTVFLSHGTEDKQVAARLCEALEAAGIQVWIAPRDIRPGETWAAAILRAIDECDVMVLVLSRHANESQHVIREVQHAVEDGDPIFLFRTEQLVLADELRYYLGTHQYVEVDATAGGAASDGQLVDAVRAYYETGVSSAPQQAGPSPAGSRRRRMLAWGGAAALALAVLIFSLTRGDAEEAAPNGPTGQVLRGSVVVEFGASLPEHPLATLVWGDALVPGEPAEQTSAALEEVDGKHLFELHLPATAPDAVLRRLDGAEVAAASIVLVDDANGDGTFDAGEPALSAVPHHLLAYRTGDLDAALARGERLATCFADVPEGVTLVRAATKDGGLERWVPEPGRAVELSVSDRAARLDRPRWQSIFTLSGRVVRSADEGPIPSETLVGLLWANPEGSNDFASLHGLAPVAPGGGFELRLEEEPPEHAFMSHGDTRVAVAWILAFADPEGDGRVAPEQLQSQLRGADPEHCLLILQGEPPEESLFSSVRPGITVARYVSQPGSRGFESRSTATVEIRYVELDNPKALDVPEWH